MVWKIDNPQCNESKKIVWEVAPYLRGRGIDVGAGDFKILPQAISVDNMHHNQMFGFNFKPDIVAEADDLSIFGSQQFDWVYSSHTLEHVDDMEKTLKEWWRVLKPGGRLVLYLPHKDFYPNIGQPGANPDHKRDFVPEDVIAAMPNGWDLIVNQDRNEDQEYSFLLVFVKLRQANSKNVRSYQEPKPEKTACVVRYGAYGDMLQSSSVWAGLKKQGYHVTVHCSWPGSDAVKHDPNIDNLIIFDKDQVPNANLGDFWRWHEKKYDKWVNLSESVEKTFLAQEGFIQFMWPPHVRHARMNQNYVEFQHMLADIPHEPRIHFYTTEEERIWAKQTRHKMGSGPVVMWSLSGSSVHKTWAGMDSIIAGIMIEYPTAHVVLVGGPEGVILEQGWEKEPRVHKTSGKWTIRQTLSFMHECQVIFGPETGVLNAAAMEPMKKVVLLSHSSDENLTRDWVNVAPIWSEKTSCPKRPEGIPACHMLHFSWSTCQRSEDGAQAQCQADINPEQVWNAIASSLSEYMRKAA